MTKSLNETRMAAVPGNICCYQAGGRIFVRAKSSLTRSRVLKSKEFESTRKYAGNMGLASRMASSVYQSLPADVKERWLFRAITGNAASLLYSGIEEPEVKEILIRKYLKPGIK